MKTFLVIMMLLFAIASMGILFVTVAELPDSQFERNMHASHMCLGMAVIFAACYLVLLFKDK